MKPRRSKVDWVLEGVALAALLAAIAFAVLNWGEMFERGPRRLFRPTFYTVKNGLSMVLAMNFAAYAGLTAATYFRKLISIPAEIERDLPHAPQLLFSMVIVLKTLLMLFSAYVVWSLVEVGQGRDGALSPAFVGVFVLVVAVPLIFYTLKVREYQ